MDDALLIYSRSETGLSVYLESCFAPLRRLTFLCLRIAARRKEKQTKESAHRHPGLAAAPPNLPPSGAAPGAGLKGHPWPFKRGRLVLSPHPCSSSPCATPPLGLLTGTRAPGCLVVLLCAARSDSSHALRGNAAVGALRQLWNLVADSSKRSVAGWVPTRSVGTGHRAFRRRQTPLQEGEWNRRGKG